MSGPNVTQTVHHHRDQIRQRMQRTISVVPTVAHDKFVRVSLKPLVPLILASSALVYHEGQQAKLAQQSNQPYRNSWQSIVAESALGCMLLKYTSGIYPLMGLGVAIYRASKQDNALDQLKAAINTGVTMGMGFLGANALDSTLLERLENGKIRDIFEANPDQGKHLHDWIEKLKGHSEEPLQHMGEQLAQLKHQLTEELPNLEKDKADRSVIQAMRDTIGETKSQLGDKILEYKGAALAEAPEHAQDAAQNLLRRLAESQGAVTKLTRAINPVCSFMAAAFLLGTPLSNWINGRLEHRRPDLKQKQMKQVLFPESQRILKRPEHSGVSSHGGHSYGVMSGPYVNCPDASDKPMQ